MFSYESIQELVLKSVALRDGVKNNPIPPDVIYGQPLMYVIQGIKVNKKKDLKIEKYFGKRFFFLFAKMLVKFAMRACIIILKWEGGFFPSGKTSLFLSPL